MHSRIFEIDAKAIERDDWAGESTIADENGEIEGVDYYSEITDENERCEDIENLFTEWFPDNSFKIISNIPGQTAVVRFVGDIKSLYQKWMDEIKAHANELTIEEMNRLNAFRVRKACEEPFDLSIKFSTSDRFSTTTFSLSYEPHNFLSRYVHQNEQWRIYPYH